MLGTAWERLWLRLGDGVCRRRRWISAGENGKEKELRGFEGKLKVFLQGLQCFKAQIRLCFKGMHTETTECADMRTGHSGSSLLLLSPLGAWSDSQQCLEPQLWSQTESLGGRVRTKIVQGSPRDRN